MSDVNVTDFGMVLTGFSLVKIMRSIFAEDETSARRLDNCFLVIRCNFQGS